MLTDLILVDFVLTNSQWEQVVSFSGLPPEARVYVGRAITLYRCGIPDRPSDTRAKLEELSKDALALCEALKELHDHSLALVVLTLALKPSQRFETAMEQQIARRRLAANTRELQRLAVWLSAAGNHVAKGRSGARARAVLIQLLVTELDLILKRFTGKHFRRSDKISTPGRQYVEAVCKIADPSIKRGSIDAAMRRQIASRGKISR
jgi:hypothetical protein